MVEWRDILYFWFWNKDLNEKQLGGQLRRMKENGVNHVLVHLREGMSLEDCFSDKFYGTFGAMATLGRGLDMNVSYYPEFNWPTGTAGGRVTRNPKFVAKAMDKNGKVVPGSFKVAYHNQPYVDVLSTAAANEYVHLALEPLLRLKSEFGDTIRTVFFDETGSYVNFLSAYNRGNLAVTDGFAETHTRIHGRDFTADRKMIFGDNERQNIEARIRYFETFKEFNKRGLVATATKWCAQNDLITMGHLPAEENLLEMVKTNGDPFDALSKFDWPGYDVIGGNNRLNHKIAAKFAKAVKELYEKEISFSEVFGGFGSKFRPEQMGPVLDDVAANGSNIAVNHAVFQSLKGFRKHDSPPDLGQPDYLSLHKGLRQRFQDAKSNERAKIAIYAPIAAIQGEYNPIDERPARKISKSFHEACERVVNAGFDFDILNDEGILKFGHRYERVYFPSATVLPFESLKALHDAEVEIVFYDQKPRVALHQRDQGKLEEMLRRLDSTHIAVDRGTGKLALGSLFADNFPGIEHRLLSGKSPTQVAAYHFAKGMVGMVSGYAERRLK